MTEAGLARDGDRGQAEVMKVMMMTSMVTDMHEMDPQNKTGRKKKPRPKAENGNPSMKVSVGHLSSSVPNPARSKWQIISPA